MTIHEFNNLNVLTKLEYQDTNWFQGFGIIKKYQPKTIAFTFEDTLVFGDAKEVLSNITKNDAQRLRDLGWEISEHSIDEYPNFIKKL